MKKIITMLLLVPFLCSMAPLTVCSSIEHNGGLAPTQIREKARICDPGKIGYLWYRPNTISGVWTQMTPSQVQSPGQVSGPQSVLENFVTPILPSGTYQFKYVYPDGGSGNTQCESDIVVLTISTVLALPKLLSFTASSISTGVKISWKIQNDIDIDRYEVQRINENGVFTTIALIMPNALPEYEYKDLHSLTSTYRLKVIGKNNENYYSNVVTVQKTPNTTVDVAAYPNPVVNILHIRLNGLLLTGKEIITIKNMMGQIIPISYNNSSVNVAGLPAGIYTLSVEDKNKNTQIIKFIKS